MAEVGRTLHESLFSQKIQTNKCTNCNYPLEVYEIDFKKNRKVLKCQRCGLYHFYKKDLVGRWKLQRAKRADLPK
jgi:transcription elongation factor Elf1